MKQIVNLLFVFARFGLEALAPHTGDKATKMMREDDGAQKFCAS
jgi:hypothetical protein